MALELVKPDRAEALDAHIRARIAEPEFPCVGAKSALARGSLEIVVAHSIASAWDDLSIHRKLVDWGREYRADPEGFRSLAVAFSDTETFTEAEFERHMWDRIQSIADKDAWLGQPYDTSVSPDPDDPHFSLSFGGEAFFVVGLHPGSSRPARQFDCPVMVFNLHDQFERLREEGRYAKMRATIMKRDVALAGDENPMLATHGEVSAARQYSGRVVNDDWRCPFSDKRAS